MIENNQFVWIDYEKYVTSKGCKLIPQDEIFKSANNPYS